MPGHKGNRTKGNVKPSSSSRAAELLNQSGSGSGGFIGFGGLGGTAAYVPASQAFDDVDTCLDSQFRVVLRKLTKRDATTKIKALGEFSALCKETDDNTLLAVLPFWPRLYNKMAIDCDQKVRECTQNSMATLVSRVRRNLAPYLKNVMGAWMLSRNDTYPTVASAANKAFSAAFPPDKQENAIVFCKQAVLEYMVDNLLNQTASTLSDPKTTEKEEMDAKLVRVQCSSLMGLRQLLLTLPSAQLDDEFKGHLRGLLNEGKFWNLSKSPQLLVRSGQFGFLGGLCQVVPDVALEYVQKITPLVFSSIDILEPSLTGAVWDAVLSLVKFVPECWEKINWQKAFWPKLKKLLESGCQGNASSVAPNILPLLSCVPVETAGGAAVFFPRVLEHFKLGFAQDSVAKSPSETVAWSRSFIECLQFSFRQIGSDSPSSLDVLHNILLEQLVPLLEASLLNAKPTLSRSHLYPAVSVFLRTVESKTETSSLAAACWSQLSGDLVAVFDTVGSTGDHSLRSERLVSFIKALLYPQDSSNPGSNVKGEHVKFASETGSQVHTRVPVLQEAAISGAMKSFVKTMVVQSHKLYQKDRSCAHFKLFVELANLYFPADIADFMLRSLEGEGDDGSGDGVTREGEGQSRADAHSKVIDRVVLPVLGGKEQGENTAEIVDHTITLLFSCLPYLSQQSSTAVWDNVLQSVSSTSALCSLIERALDKRQIMPQVSKWLSSPALHSRLCDLVSMVTTQHSKMVPSDLEQGWKVICLVLSANDDNEPVFPSSWIVDVVSSVHRELVTLGSRALDPEEAQVAIQFVARAALTFFENLKLSLCLGEGRDVIVALMMADLDCSFSSAGEASSMLRQSWKVGLGLAVRDTGGLIQEGGILSSACSIVRDTILTKTMSMDQFRRVMEVTDELLEMTQSYLPQGETDDEGPAHNPVLVALLSELVVPPCATFTYSTKIVQFLCLTGQLPLTKLEFLSDGREDHCASMTKLIFTSLFNMGLLQHYRSHFTLDGAASAETVREDSMQEPWENEAEVILDAVKSVVLANTWLKVEHQVSASVVCAVEELTKSTHTGFSSSRRSLQHTIMESACARMNKDLLSSLTVTQLAHLLSALGTESATYFQQFYSEKIDSIEGGEEVLVPFLPLWKMMEMFSLQAAVLTSITADTLPAAVACLRIMGACMVKDSPAIVSEHQDLLQVCVNNLKTLRDEHSNLFLFSCDISEVPLWQVAFNVSSMRFLTEVVKADPCILTPDLWDFMLCSAVSWIESLDNSSVSLSSPTSLQTFCVEACQLLAAVAHTIQQLLPENRDAYPASLETEWKEFFAEGIYAFLFPLFIRLLDERTECKKGEADMILGAVGSAMAQCPQDKVVGHSLPLKLVASDHDSPLPESIQTLLNCLCPALTCPLAPAQVTAYSLLEKIMPLVPTYHKEKEAVEAASAADSESRQEPPPAMLMKVIEDCATAMDHVLSNVAMGTTVTMAPGTEEYQFALGYLLAWQLMLHLFHSAGSKGRAEYASYLRDHSTMYRLLTHLFSLMPASPFLSSSPVKSPGGAVASPFKSQSSESGACESLFETSVMKLSAVDVGCTEDIQHVACCVYLHCLEVIPVLVRQWWKNQDRKSAAFVDKFTTKHVSPQLIKSEMQSVNSSESAIPDLIVKANHITRQVTASYTTEELKAEIQITLPESYPLGEISVESQRHAVVKQQQWERMLLQLNIFLQHQNGTIMEGLRLWKRNIDKRIEGVEECFICYAVIHASNYELPMVPCKTCKKKFHKACLYKWLNSSQNSTCPLCRSIF